ncbi:hypothetical protein HYX02_07085 [Candidatus Woesearchaeota archaeon]|nr:hypothetical protein [Candidatus Woesearchaeota archaeon]
MKKLLFIVFTIFLISIAACQQAAKEPEKKEGAMEKTEVPATTGDAAVDAVGKDLNSVDTVDKDLSTDELADLDAGLQDVQNI